ncbi:MAG TPA: hypothetical protein VH062_01345 [Polyangiaceae bacterium]|nr:hypothetical protein [Polyangiaceae bacterium]
MTVPATSPVAVTVDGRAVECTPYMQGSDWPYFLGLKCNPEVPSTADVSVDFSEGIVGAATGSAVRDEFNHTAFKVELPPGDSSIVCTVLREEDPFAATSF